MRPAAKRGAVPPGRNNNGAAPPPARRNPFLERDLKPAARVKHVEDKATLDYQLKPWEAQGAEKPPQNATWNLKSVTNGGGGAPPHSNRGHSIDETSPSFGEFALKRTKPSFIVKQAPRHHSLPVSPPTGDKAAQDKNALKPPAVSTPERKLSDTPARKASGEDLVGDLLVSGVVKV